MGTKKKWIKISGYVSALLTALLMAFGSLWLWAFYFGFVFNPPGSAHDAVLERFWRGERESKLKKIRFRRVEITKKQTLQAFDKLISERSNFRPDASLKQWDCSKDDWVRFEFFDGSTWTSYYSSWTPDGFLLIVRALLPSIPPFFESGHDEVFLPFPPEVREEMDLILKFLSVTRMRYEFPKLVIEDNGYMVYREKGFYLLKKTFHSIGELEKVMEKGDL